MLLDRDSRVLNVKSTLDENYIGTLIVIISLRFNYKKKISAYKDI